MQGDDAGVLKKVKNMLELLLTVCLDLFGILMILLKRHFSLFFVSIIILRIVASFTTAKLKEEGARGFV